jgi:hypothetical protein
LWNATLMQGRIILTLSGFVLFIGGGAALFAPQELARLVDPAASDGMPLAIQLVGCALLGFASLNWMSRRNRIGGIYARPIGIGNLVLFATGALAIGKHAAAREPSIGLVALCGVFAALAASFAWLVFAHDPLTEQPTKNIP